MRSEQQKKGDQGKELSLVPLVQRKLLLLRKYLSITEELQGISDRKETAGLWAVITRRQRCAEEVEKTDTLLQKAAREAYGGSGKPAVEVRGVLDFHFKEMKEVLSGIASLDKELVYQLKEESEMIKGELLKMRTVRSATRQYCGYASQSPRFLNVSR